MKKIILIQYGELSTKKDNKNYFISTLYNNIVNKMKNMDVIVKKDMARMYIEFREEEFDKIKSIIDTIFGIRLLMYMRLILILLKMVLLKLLIV